MEVPFNPIFFHFITDFLNFIQCLQIRKHFTPSGPPSGLTLRGPAYSQWCSNIWRNLSTTKGVQVIALALLTVFILKNNSHSYLEIITSCAPKPLAFSNRQKPKTYLRLLMPRAIKCKNIKYVVWWIGLQSARIKYWISLIQSMYLIYFLLGLWVIFMTFFSECCVILHWAVGLKSWHKLCSRPVTCQ